MRMKQGEGYTIEEAGRLSSEKDCAFLISCAFCRRIVCLTAEVRVRLLLTWVGVSILINVSNSLADDLEVTAGAHKFQKFFGLSRRNYKKIQ